MPDKKVLKVCSACASPNVVADASVTWNVHLQDWEINDVCTHNGVCADCDGPCRIVEKEVSNAVHD
jgi:hypothetical protein